MTATTSQAPAPGRDSVRATARRWPATIRRLLLTVLMGAVLGVLAGVNPASADPSPIPSPTTSPGPQPTGSPTAPGVPAPSASDNPQCGGTVPGTAQRWCFLWIRYTTSPPQGAPSHWITACEQALTTDDQLLCQTVALTLDDRPRDGTPTVLSDVAPGAPSAPELVRCSLFTDRAAADSANANRWTYKRDRCAVMARTLSFQLRDPSAGSAPPSTPPAEQASDCGLTDVSCRVAGILDNAVSNGIQGLVTLTVKTMAWLLAEVAKIVFNKTAPPRPDEAFYFTYNSTASIVLLFVLLFFIITTIINGLRVNGPGPLSTLGGLVRAMFGIMFAGGLAWIIVAAWDEATNSLIEANQDKAWDPALWVKAVSTMTGGGTTLIALLIAGLSIIGLLLLAITQLFRSELAEGAALLGAFAMAGQVAPETKHWARRWFWTLNALGMSRFVTVELWIYGTRATYESDLITAIKGLLLIWMMVMTPWVLLRLLTIVDGYLSDINARGVMAAVGSQAAQAADGAPGSPSSSGGPGQQAAQVMNSNLADLQPSSSGSPAGGQQAGAGMGQAQQQLGLKDGPPAQAANAVSTSGDGSGAGDPGGSGGPASGAGDGGQAGSSGGADHPNADEAAGVQQSGQQAKADVNAATTVSSNGGGASPGGGATGGGAPAGGGGAAGGGGTDSTTTASSTTGSTTGGDDSGSATGAAATNGTDPLTAAAGAEQHHQPAEAPQPPELPPPPDTPSPGGDHGSGPAGEASGQPPGGGGEAPPGGGSPPAGSGGSAGGAAAGAADIPIVPV